MQEVRAFFTATVLRIVTSPLREVSWADFLLADVLTSLSKALSDVERAACHLLAGPVMQPHTSDQVGGLASPALSGRVRPAGEFKALRALGISSTLRDSTTVCCHACRTGHQT